MTRVVAGQSDDAAVVEAFLAAAEHTGDVLASPAVGAGWSGPSALAEMSVGALAGHVFLVLRRILKHLDEPAADAGEGAAGEGVARAIQTYPATRMWRGVRVERREDLDLPLHCKVRDDGAHVAAWGWEAVCAAYADRRGILSTRLRSERPSGVALGPWGLAVASSGVAVASSGVAGQGGTIAFPAYLSTRIVELLAHADDLVVSVGIDPPPLPEQAAGIAVGLLVDAARHLHGDVELIRALTRRERAPLTLSIF
jgi:hypothetical protein